MNESSIATITTKSGHRSWQQTRPAADDKVVGDSVKVGVGDRPLADAEVQRVRTRSRRRRVIDRAVDHQPECQMPAC